MLNPRLIVLALFMPVIACELDPSGTGLGPPRVRVVNAAAGTSTVTVYLDGAQQGMTTDPLSYKSGSDCLLVADAAHSFVFAQSTGTLASVSGTMERGKSYTVLLVASGTTFRAVLLLDEAVVPTGNNGFRFLNATSVAGDVYVTVPNAVPSVATKVAADLGALALSNQQPAFVMRPEGDTQIRLFDVGTSTTPRADLGLALLPFSRLANIVFVTKTIDSEPGALQFNACS